MALILKRRKGASKVGTDQKNLTEGTAANFAAAPNSPSDGTTPETTEQDAARVATGPKKLVIKGKKTSGNAHGASDKASEPAETTVKASVKARNPFGLTVCEYCRYERRNPCHGSTEHRGSYDKDGKELECASKRLVDRLKAEGKNPFGQPVEVA